MEIVLSNIPLNSQTSGFILTRRQLDKNTKLVKIDKRVTVLI